MKDKKMKKYIKIAFCDGTSVLLDRETSKISPIYGKYEWKFIQRKKVYFFQFSDKNYSSVRRSSHIDPIQKDWEQLAKEITKDTE